MLVKIEFRTGSWLVVDAGGMFQSEDKCRDAFIELLNGGPAAEFVRLDDFQGRRLILNRRNVNSVEVGYQRGAGERHRPDGKR